MIPILHPKSGHTAHVLPTGLHYVTFREFRDAFVTNPHRQWLFEGFRLACQELRSAGCGKVFVGGSFVTSKEFPSDYDACWDTVGVSCNLDPVIYDDNLGIERREKYRGDWLMGGCEPGPTGEFFRFLSRDKVTGEERGMIGIKLRMVELLNS